MGVKHKKPRIGVSTCRAEFFKQKSNWPVLPFHFVFMAPSIERVLKTVIDFRKVALSLRARVDKANDKQHGIAT